MVMGELSFLAFDGSGCVLPVMSDFVTLWKESPEVLYLRADMSSNESRRAGVKG